MAKKAEKSVTKRVVGAAKSAKMAIKKMMPKKKVKNSRR
jgi:hypothetical protein